MSAFEVFRRGRSRAILLGAAMILLVLPGIKEARAQGKLEARYQAWLAGIPVARGSWVVDIAEDRFKASADGGSSGLLNAFAGGKGSGVAEGRVVNGQFVPVSYVSTYASDKKSSTRLQFAGGNVKDASIEPEPEPAPDRIALTETHRRGVVDPMTGLLLQVPGAADPVSREACSSGRAIFSGQMRFDLRFEFKRIETLKTKGYQGPAVVCAVYFTPIAGHVPDRAGVKYAAAPARYGSVAGADRRHACACPRQGPRADAAWACCGRGHAVRVDGDGTHGRQDSVTRTGLLLRPAA